MGTEEEKGEEELVDKSDYQHIAHMENVSLSVAPGTCRCMPDHKTVLRITSLLIFDFLFSALIFFLMPFSVLLSVLC